MIKHVSITTDSQGLRLISDEIETAVKAAGIKEGLCTVFLQHTSASLVIQENYDPSARHDLEQWLNRLVAEHDPLYTHTDEGPDDMPSHIKAALTNTSLSIPVTRGRLALGAWQGVYLWEHRRTGSNRTLIVHIST